jgi:hypothetical protein
MLLKTCTSHVNNQLTEHAMGDEINPYFPEEYVTELAKKCDEANGGR